MKIFQKNRYSIIFLMIIIFVAVSTISRSVLLVTDIGNVDVNIISLVKVYLVGFFYDVVASFYFVIPSVIYLFILPNKIFNNVFHKYCTLGVFFVTTYWLVFSAASEWFFWEEFGKRFNFIAVDYLIYTHEVIRNILESYPIPLLLSMIFIITALIFYFISKNTQIFKNAFISEQSYLDRLKISSVLLMLPIIFFNIMDKQALSDISINQYNNELAKNGNYSFFSAFRNNTLDYNEFYKNKNIKVVMDNLEKLTGFNGKDIKKIVKDGSEKQYNVMLIMVESLSAEYIGTFGNTQNITPNIDKLIKSSLFFDNLYATGTRTVRGMEAVTLSVPPTPGRSIVKRPDNHNMFSSGFVFKDKGYENKFIYAGYGYFDNMNEFFSNNGFEVIDKINIAKDETTFENAWGVCDEDLFNKTIKESDIAYAKNKPFFNFIMTTSNHRPYTYPDNKIDISSGKGRNGAVKYTDYAINKFIEDSKAKPWFKDTIFVIVADHNGGSAGKNELPVYRYKIPLIIYAPDIIKAQKVSKLSSQIDVIPTILSLMNWSYESKFYGDDILSDNFKQRALIGNYQKLGFLRDNKLLILNPNKTIQQYNIKNQAIDSVKYDKTKADKKDEEDAITYYQSASYMFENKLYQYKE